MKILHIYRTYFPDSQGGLEEAIRQICLGTQGEGVENRVLTLQNKPGDAVVNRDECVVYRSPKHFGISSCDFGLGVLPLYSKLLDWCDVVHYHFPWPFADLLEVTRGGKKPYIVTYHSDIVRQKWLGVVYRPLMNHFLTRASMIIATSKNYFATSSILSNHSDKVSVIPLGIQEESYPQLDQKVLGQMRKRHGSNFFLFVGVFRYYKGLHILLDAIQGAGYKVIIAGSGSIEGELKERASNLGLDNVVFPGYVSESEKIALLHLCRAVVFPSYLRSEAFGMTLVEGAMIGKPLISTEVGTGTSYVNQDGVTGLVVSPGNSKDLREAMDYLYYHPKVAERMGKEARKRYEALFTGGVVGREYQAIYKRVAVAKPVVAESPSI